MRVLVPAVVVAVTVARVGGWDTPAPPAAPPGPAADLLTRYCVSCHGQAKPKADFRVDTLLTAAPSEADLTHWTDILGRLETGDMPPKGKPRPSDAEYAAATAAIRRAVAPVEAAAEAKKPRALRRLNRREYSNAVRDLFGLDLRPGDDLPPDDALHGFDTVAAGLSVSAVQVEQYLKVARRVVEAAVPEEEWPGLRRNDAWNPKDHPDHFGASGQWGWPTPAGLLWTFREIGPGGYGQVPVGGVYRATYTLIPRHLKGAPGKVETSPGRVELHDFTGPAAPHLVGTAAEREVAEVHVTPDQDGRQQVVTLTGYLDRGREPGDFALRFLNGTPGDVGMDKRGLHAKTGGYFRPTSPAEVPANWPYLQVVGKTFEGPLEEFWPPAPVRAVLDAGKPSNDPAKSLAVFLPRAFRRPVTPAEVEEYAALARQEMKRGGSFAAGLKVALRAALASPDFLFVVENAPADAPRGSYKLTDPELATRLSLFLWSSVPDPALAAAKLSDRAVRAAAVERLLADPRSAAFATDFTRQWLGLAKLGSAMPEPTLFAEFNPQDEYYEYYGTRLKRAMAREPVALAEHVLAADRPVTDFLAADYAVIDEALARLYGIKGVVGGQHRPVPLPAGSPRGGLLGMAAVLTLTSEATRTSPVIRGKWVLERLFNRPPPPPPPAAGAIEPDTTTARSLREKIALHRADAACAGCHARIDPFGLALENFDAVGRWRTHEPPWHDPARPQPAPPKSADGKPVLFPIDAVAELAGGIKLDGAAGLRSHLLARKDEFVRGLAEKLMIYAAGRGLTAADTPDVDRVVARTKAGGYKMHALILAVVESDAFLTR